MDRGAADERCVPVDLRQRRLVGCGVEAVVGNQTPNDERTELRLQAESCQGTERVR